VDCDIERQTHLRQLSAPAARFASPEKSRFEKRISDGRLFNILLASVPIRSYDPSNRNPEKRGISRKTGEVILFGEADVTGSESQETVLAPTPPVL
jgi:hypothetical protein